MGNSRYVDHQYRSTTQSFQHQTRAQVFDRTTMQDAVNPAKFA